MDCMQPSCVKKIIGLPSVLIFTLISMSNMWQEIPLHEIMSLHSVWISFTLQNRIKEIFKLVEKSYHLLNFLRIPSKIRKLYGIWSSTGAKF